MGTHTLEEKIVVMFGKYNLPCRQVWSEVVGVELSVWQLCVKFPGYLLVAQFPGVVLLL
jgi:hypothetical protein